MHKYAVNGFVALVCVTITGAFLAAQNPNQNPQNPPPQTPQNPPNYAPQQPVQQPPTQQPYDPNQQQPSQTAPSTQQPVYQGQAPAAPPQVARRMKQVIGGKVSIQGGVSIGTVDDIIFNDDGCIDYVVVINEGRYVVMPWTAAKFNFEDRTATVNVTQERWREVPTFTAQTYPTINYYEPAFVQRVYGYYGVQVPVRHDVRTDRRGDRRDDRRR
ncbi:MAG: PRC-barrel domain-containing protein [Gemmataceae bacterium]